MKIIMILLVLGCASIASAQTGADLGFDYDRQHDLLQTERPAVMDNPQDRQFPAGTMTTNFGVHGFVDLDESAGVDQDVQAP